MILKAETNCFLLCLLSFVTLLEMAMKISAVSWFLRLILVSSILLINKATSQEERKVYIVYMGELHGSDTRGSTVHSNMLQKVCGSELAPNFLLHSFKRSFNGFVAMLTEKEAKIMSGLSNVVSVFPSETEQLHTTRSWDFMGFSRDVKRTAIESDIIVGVIDTGIWPESESFSDVAFGTPPSKWKGTCQVSNNFTCNNKIIGARYYRASGDFTEDEFISPRDSNGHGTHTASTVGGNQVSVAGLYDLASGIARGGVPSTRVAIYKVCWRNGCDSADILAAFDDAIADGVDIISISIGSRIVADYFVDPKAIGSFHAMRKGILTSISAGNNGPTPGSITNVSPWTLSVAASTIDRKFITKVQLGDGNIYEGVSVNTFDMGRTMYPLIDATNAPNISGNFTPSTSRFCRVNSLDMNMVKDKIVFCHTISSGSAPFYAGAIGTIFVGNDSTMDDAESFPLPASHLSMKDGSNISSYINKTSNPSATIFKSNKQKDTLAPYVASFSSRGPNPINQDILKPDLTAPGVDILATWSLVNSVSRVKGDKRFVPYNIISGTSMACPHASAAVAYVKSLHPGWSPAAIKSALMTTARPMNVSLNNNDNFAFGAGHIDPSKAVTPGLIYDADEIDYISFLCGQGYNHTMLKIITGNTNIDCSKINGTIWDLNYPSFALSTSSTDMSKQTFTRVVTNVGFATSSYHSILSSTPLGPRIEVTPNVLTFTSLGEKLSFKLTIEGKMGAYSIISASLTWDDGQHEVRSPIVVYATS